jgi:glycosyltransferase involved in cell wall biosynthesis
MVHLYHKLDILEETNLQLRLRRYEDKDVGKLNLAVFNTQPPHLYFGGVERRIIETCKRLSSRISITVYSGTKAGFNKPAKVNGLTVIPCFSTDALFPVDNWFFNHSLANARDKIEADIYEAHNASGYAFLKSLRKLSSKTPFVQTVHGVLADEYFRTLRSDSLPLRERIANLLTWRLSKLEAESARDANLVVTVSNYSAKMAAHLYNLDMDKLRVVPNGVDTEKFKPSNTGCRLKRELGIEDKQVVLFVGRLIPRKGLHFLVEAAAQVLIECNDTVFIIVGDGPLRNSLTSQLARLGLLKHFLFLGDVKESVLPRLYNCADVFAFPSVQEGQGIALLEAQASEKPVVAFNVGGVDETVRQRQSGLLVDLGNSHRLGEAILKLLSDSSLRHKMGTAGRDFVLSNYTWAVCAEKMLKVYREVI